MKPGTNNSRRTCANCECSYAEYCLNHEGCMPISKEAIKSIANNVAHLVCSDWKLLSLASLIESDGRKLEKIVHSEQTSKGFTACFRSPY